MQDFTLTTYKKFLQDLLANGYSFQFLQSFIQKPENKTIILRHDVDRKPENALVIANIEKEVGIKSSYYFRIVKESYDEDIIRQIAKMGHEIGYHYEDLDLSWRGLRSEVRSQEEIEVGGLKSEVRRAKASVVDRPGEIRPSTIFRTYGINFARHLREFHWVKKSEVRGQKELDYDALLDKAIKSFEINLSALRKIYPVKTICMHGSPLSKYDNKEIWKKYDYRDYGIIAEPYFDVDFDKVFYMTDKGRKI